MALTATLCVLFDIQQVDQLWWSYMQLNLHNSPMYYVHKQKSTGIIYLVYACTHEVLKWF